MQKNNIDWGKGRVIFWDMHDLNFDESIESQIDKLKEDLAQIEYSKNLLLDIGWYPEFNSGGSFWVQVIYNENWEKPIYKKNCRSFNELINLISEASSIASET